MPLFWRKLGHFPDRPWLHQHSVPMLGHITQSRYLTRAHTSSTCLNNCQGFFSQPWEPPFNLLQFPHLLKQPLNRITDPDSGLFCVSSQVTRLKLSTPPYPRENNNKLKTMSPLSVFGERMGIANHKGGTGQGMGPFWGRHGMKLNK